MIAIYGYLIIMIKPNNHEKLWHQLKDHGCSGLT